MTVRLCDKVGVTSLLLFSCHGHDYEAKATANVLQIKEPLSGLRRRYAP